MAEASKKKKIFDGKYEILNIVGRGACSVVYHARHVTGDNADVALKVLLDKRSDGSKAELLRKEALAMVSARHKYVIRLDDFHCVGELAYLSMEYAPESDLRKYVKRTSGKLGPIQGQLFLIQSAEALNFTHQAGIIHRDIKPDNILVISDKEVRLGDFGVAVLPGEKSSINELQQGVGTMSYMGPEVLEGVAYDQRSDIYALGVSFYELLSSVHPFENAPLMKQLEIRKDGAYPPLDKLNPSLPKQLVAAIAKCMSYNPSDRFQTAKELVQSLLIAPTTPAQPKSQVQTQEQAPQQVKPAESKQIERKVVCEEPKKAIESKKPEMKASPGDGLSKPFTLGTRKDKKQPSELGIHRVEPKTPAQTEAKQAEERQIEPKGDATLLIKREAVEKLIGKTSPERQVKKQDVRSSGSLSKIPLDTKKRSYMTTAILVFLLMVLPVLNEEINELVKRYLRVDVRGTVTNLVGPSAQDEIEKIIPAYQGEELAFPLFPAGLFQGQIKDFVPGRKVPLTVISLAKQGKLIVIVGIEGWSPAVIPYNELPSAESDNKVLVVKSNGFVLELTGENIDGELFGYFENKVSGDKGEWDLRPIT